MIKFLAITDLHYCDRDIPDDERRNCLSASKLKKVIESHADGCDFIVNLGDTADGLEGYGNQEEFMVEIAGILKSSKLPYHCAIGNHDTSMPKPKVTEILNMPHRYYSFETDDFTFIVLDANINDICKPYPDEEIQWAYTHLDPEQLAWLNATIYESEKDVIVFCHELFMKEYYENIDDHVIMNRDEAVSVFENSGKVKAVFSGHYHFGDYVCHNGIHYTAFNSLCLHDEASCAVVTIDNGKVTVDGHGFQKSYEFKLN